MGLTWGPTGSCWPKMGPMLAPWTLLSRIWVNGVHESTKSYCLKPQQNKANQNHLHIGWDILHFQLLTPGPLRDVIMILKVQFSNICYTESSQTLIVKLLSGECHRTHLMISQHWFRWWLGAIRQQAITLANVDLDLCCHRATLARNEFKHDALVDKTEEFKYKTFSVLDRWDL